MTTTIDTTTRELDHRSGNGIHVTLLWQPGTRRVSLDVYDESLGESFAFEVPPGRARDAFHHPYAYAPSTVVETAARLAAAVDA